MNSLLIWGAGGHGKVVFDCAVATGSFARIAFIDDRPAAEFCGVPVLGDSTRLAFARAAGYSQFLVAIGSNPVRARCFQCALAAGLEAATVIHPSAVISSAAALGGGTVVMPRVVVNSSARIGRDVILNTASVIEHDCIVGDHAHISPCAALGGGVHVGSYAHIGIGAIALPLARIGASAVVGAGAVVLREVSGGVTAVGVPARALVSPAK